MKKHNFLSKTTACLLAIGVSMALFAGCQSSSSNSGTASNATQSTSKQNGNKPSAEQMKKRVQDSIQPLVTAGTITQAQADKIIAAYEARPAGNGQKNKTQDNQQSSQQGSTQNNGQNKQRFNPLSKLVSDGTITQAQADAVTQKMKENSTHKNNGQSSN
ncbi:hypothetical protein [Clostridium sp. JS66]|uniref:hypothetical protein n=1 Tax=Clostridium sp. JS66 TaxID=3064705 RepID=UPI00298EBA1B|nr:hypothetical protein [Clostridium sp. JS66]WPC39964.1 hypothetical protein Q6H37_18910 [Clostridium sp. JS66]